MAGGGGGYGGCGGGAIWQWEGLEQRAGLLPCSVSMAMHCRDERRESLLA